MEVSFRTACVIKLKQRWLINLLQDTVILRDHPEALPDFLYCLGPWSHPQTHISSCGNTDLHSSHCIYPILNKLSHVVRLRDKSVRCLGCKFLGITQR